MRLARTVLSWMAVALLGVGYFASQVAYFAGSPTEYAQRMDQAGIRLIALILFAGAIVLAFFPDREAT